MAKKKKKQIEDMKSFEEIFLLSRREKADMFNQATRDSKEVKQKAKGKLHPLMRHVAEDTAERKVNQLLHGKTPEHQRKILEILSKKRELKKEILGSEKSKKEIYQEILDKSDQLYEARVDEIVKEELKARVPKW